MKYENQPQFSSSVEEVDDDVDEVEADETVFAGSEDAMLDSRSGDMADSAKKKENWHYECI